MRKTNGSEDLVDFIDLVNFTLSNEFIAKWRYKYSERFIKLFQLKLLSYLSKGSPIRVSTLFKYLNKTCKYSQVQVSNFFESVDIEDYSPLVIRNTKK